MIQTFIIALTALMLSPIASAIDPVAFREEFLLRVRSRFSARIADDLSSMVSNDNFAIVVKKLDHGLSRINYAKSSRRERNKISRQFLSDFLLYGVLSEVQKDCKDCHMIRSFELLSSSTDLLP